MVLESFLKTTPLSIKPILFLFPKTIEERTLRPGAPGLQIINPLILFLVDRHLWWLIYYLRKEIHLPSGQISMGGQVPPYPPLPEPIGVAELPHNNIFRLHLSQQPKKRNDEHFMFIVS